MVDSTQKPSGLWRLLHTGMVWSDLHFRKKLPDDFMENKLEGENGNKERQCEAVAITPVKNAESLKPDWTVGNTSRRRRRMRLRRWLDMTRWLSRYGHWGKGWWQRWLSSRGLGSWVEGGAVLLGGNEGWDARLGENAVTVLAPRRMMSWRRSRISYPWE